MSLNTSNKIFEIKALNITPEKFAVKTVEGALNLQWNSITNAYIVDVGYDEVLKPVLILKFKTDKIDAAFLSLPAERIGMIKMVADGKILMRMRLSKIVVDGSIDPVFIDVVKKICSNFTWTYIDTPLKEFIQNGKIDFPNKKGNEIIEYCSKVEEELVGASEETFKDSVKEIHTTSAPTTEREKWTIGSEIDGKYIVKNILYGGMGIVYVVDDKEMNRTYALKTFKDEFIFDSTVCSQFIKEAEIWTKLGKHKNIVQAERVEMKKGQPYLFLEFVDGEELESIIKRERLPILKAVDYSLQLCNGMIYAWTVMKLIHRDLKPANCFINKENVLKISDFGLGTGSLFAKEGRSNEDLLGNAAVVGTVPYMAPELFMDSSLASTQSDIYAFGIILCEMLTGVNPFFDEDPSEIIDRHLNLMPSLFDYPSEEVTPEIDYIFQKCIAKEREDRYKDFEELYQDLSVLYEDLSGAEFKKTSNETFSEEELIKRGLSLSDLGYYDEAIANFDKVIKINLRSPAMLHKGNTIALMGNYDEAIKVLDEFIKQHDTFWSGYLSKGNVLRMAKRYDEAQECLKKAESIRPENEEILSAMGNLMGDLGKYSEAIEFFDKSLEIKDQIPKTWYLLGNCYEEQKKYELANDAYAEAIELNPRSYKAWTRKGKTLYYLGFYKDSISAFKKAISLDTKDKEHIEQLEGMAQAYIKSGDLKMASDCYDKLFEKGKVSIDNLLGKSYILIKTGKTEEAIELLSSYIPIFPDDMTLKFILSALYMKVSNPLLVKTLFPNIVDNEKEQGHIETILSMSADYELNYLNSLEQDINETKKIEIDEILTDLNTFLTYTCDIEYGAEILKKIISLDENNRLKAMSYLCILEELLGNREYAEKIYNEVASVNRKNQFINDIGKRFFIKKKDAGIFYSMEINKFAKTMDGMLINAFVDYAEGNFTKALTSFELCYEKYPEAKSCLFFVSEILEKMHDTIKANSLIEEFTRYCPNSFGLYRKKILKNKKIENISKIEVWLKKIIGTVPYFYEPWIYYINILLEYGHRQKSILTALLFLDKYVDNVLLHKDSLEFFNLKATLNFIIGRYEVAKTFYSSVISLDPSNYISILGLAQCNMKLGITGESKQLLLSEYVAEDPVAKFMLSELLANERDYDEAIRIAKTNDNLPTNTITDILLISTADTLYKKGDLDEAKVYIDSLIGLYKDMPFLIQYKNKLSKGIPIETYIPHQIEKSSNSYLMNIIADDKYNKKDFFESEKDFLKISSYDIFDINSRVKLGLIAYKNKNYKQAVKYFKQALVLDSTNQVIWSFYGASLWMIKDEKSAEDAFNTAMMIPMDSILALINYSMYLLEKGKIIEAQQYAEKALRLDNSNNNAWIARGRILRKYGNLDDALTSADSALVKNQEDIKAWLLKGSIQLEKEEFQDATYTFRKTAELDQNRAEVWYNLGVLALKEKKFELAKSNIERALKEKRDFFEALYLYSVCFYLLQNVEESKHYLLEAEKVNIEKVKKYKRITGIKNNDITAPIRCLDNIDDPFFMEYESDTNFQQIFRMMDFSPLIVDDKIL